MKSQMRFQEGERVDNRNTKTFDVTRRKAANREKMKKLYFVFYF